MEKLIPDYEVELAEPGCAPGAPRWSAQVRLYRDIGEFLPYLNASLKNGRYFHEAQALIWNEQGRVYAFRPREIRIAPIEERVAAIELARQITERVNQLWAKRAEITPRFEEWKLPGIVDLYKLLPGTSCQKCAFSTCMAFAAALRGGRAKPDQCPDLSPKNRVAIMGLLP